MWDEEVDMVCAGAAAGLAHAIAIDDLGGAVFLAEAPNIVGGPWLATDVADAWTKHFFAEVTPDLRPSYDLEVPIRVVPSRSAAEMGCTVAPFVGARLREWAAQCLATPFGFLSTRVADWHAKTVQTADGELLEVFEIGALSADSRDDAGAVLDWLDVGVAERGIEVHRDHALQRLVFERGVAVGAVFATADGPLAVRARRGVTVARGPVRLSEGRRRSSADLRVCLVGQRASRFGRVELLTSEPAAVPASQMCQARGRRLPADLRATYRQPSPWRCAKLHGYPTLGD
ncbi:hypothetical protein DQP55_08725 [Mycolicibacterium sp. GF69]|nr:hypothetical protein DQP55_08725 [Mycolicibacterium sp. GF69]